VAPKAQVDENEDTTGAELDGKAKVGLPAYDAVNWSTALGHLSTSSTHLVPVKLRMGVFHMDTGWNIGCFHTIEMSLTAGNTPMEAT